MLKLPDLPKFALLILIYSLHPFPIMMLVNVIDQSLLLGINLATIGTLSTTGDVHAILVHVKLSGTVVHLAAIFADMFEFLDVFFVHVVLHVAFLVKSSRANVTHKVVFLGVNHHDVSLHADDTECLVTMGTFLTTMSGDVVALDILYVVILVRTSFIGTQAGIVLPQWNVNVWNWSSLSSCRHLGLLLRHTFIPSHQPCIAFLTSFAILLLKTGSVSRRRRRLNQIWLVILKHFDDVFRPMLLQDVTLESPETADEMRTSETLEILLISNGAHFVAMHVSDLADGYS